MKVSLFNKIKAFRFYKKTIKLNKDYLSSPPINLKIDWIYRLYTVLNLNTDVKQYGVELSQSYIKKYISDMDKQFTSLGLKEMIGIYEITKIDELNYLIVFGYSVTNTKKLANRMLISLGILILLLSTYFIFF